MRCSANWWLRPQFSFDSWHHSHVLIAAPANSFKRKSALIQPADVVPVIIKSLLF